MRSTRILLVDDHGAFRQAIRKWLNHGPYEVVGEAENGEEALSRIAAVRPDIALVDLEMPQMDGPGLIQKIRATAQPLRIIVLSQAFDESRISQLIRLGIDGHVLKSDGSSELSRALKAVSAGSRYFSSEIGKRLYDFLSGKAVVQSPSTGPELQLSARQLQVAQWVAQGKTNAEIGRILSCSENTIKTHKANIMRKLGVSNSVQLAAWVLQQSGQ